MKTKFDNRESKKNSYSHITLIALSFITGVLSANIFIVSGPGSIVENVINKTTPLSFKCFLVINISLLCIIFVSVFTRGQKLLIYAANGAKGFGIAFTVSGYLKLFGIKGYLPALFSVLCSLAVYPVFILFSVKAMELKRRFCRKNIHFIFREFRFNKSYTSAFSVSIFIIIISAVIHSLIASPISNAIRSLLG